MIEVWQPRYHDRVVLLARYRLPCGQDVDLRIKSGAYKGEYRVPNSVITKSPIELMTTKGGRTIQMRVVSLDELERKETQDV